MHKAVSLARSGQAQLRIHDKAGSDLARAAHRACFNAGEAADSTAFIYLSHNQVIGRPLTRTGTGVTLASMVVASTLVVGISASFHLRQNIPVQTVGRSMSMPVRR